MALFSQSPIAMGLYLSSWFALSTYVSGRLPGFASYGAALAGLTAGFVVLLSAPAPLTAFETALERGAEIVIGVGCVYVASAVAEIVQGKPGQQVMQNAPLPESTHIIPERRDLCFDFRRVQFARVLRCLGPLLGPLRDFTSVGT